MPALLTRPSSPPKRAVASPTARAGPSAVAMSAWIASGWASSLRSSSATASSAAVAWATSTMAMLPARPAERASCASLSTVARPIPLAAPVTSARMGDCQCNSGAIIEAFDERHHAPRRPLARARRPRERLRNPAPRAIANGRHGAAVVRRHVVAPIVDAGGRGRGGARVRARPDAHRARRDDGGDGGPARCAAAAPRPRRGPREPGPGLVRDGRPRRRRRRAARTPARAARSRRGPADPGGGPRRAPGLAGGARRAGDGARRAARAAPGRLHARRRALQPGARAEAGATRGGGDARVPRRRRGGAAARAVLRGRGLRDGRGRRARSRGGDHLVDACRRAGGGAGGRRPRAAAPDGVRAHAPAAGRAPGRRACVRRVSRAALEGLSGPGARGRRAPRCRAPASGPRGRGGRRAHPGSGRAERARRASPRDALRPGDRRPVARARRADLRLPQERSRRGALASASLKTLGRAALLAVGATLIAAVVSLLGGAGVTALDWSVYDRWLRARTPVLDTPRLVVIARDPTSEARFGTGTWDRAVVARVVAALGRGGAAVVGLDVSLGAPSAPGRGGASSDALLAESAQGVDVVSVVSPSMPRSTALHDGKIGHALAEPDADGVARAVPLWLPLGERSVPAFGLALASALTGTAAADLRIATDACGRTLVDFVGGAWPRGVQIIPFLEAWTAIEQGEADRIHTLASDNAVLVLAEPARATLRTPVGEMSPIAVQVHLARGLLAGSRLREAPPVVTTAVALLLAALAAGLLLATRWWAGLAAVVVLASAYTAALPLALATTGLVLPVVTPLGATALAAVGGLVVRHLASGARIRRLEEENARARETLVQNESTVESLEEDLDAARAAVARSTGAERDLGRAADLLREQLAEARRQEEATRRRLDALERELSGLRAADARAGELGDAGQEALRRACEEAGIVTRDPAVLAVFQDVGRAARSSLPVLILGEPGTGKELFARAAHRLSARAAQPFVAVNMAAVAPELFESELFGHVKGAFTGAVADRRGYFEQADRGTIFLDEIGELRADQQSKLLRVL